MRWQQAKTIVGVVLALACVGRPGLAHAQTTDATPAPVASSQSAAAAAAQAASNPFSSSWLMQLQQNNNWTEMPSDDTRLQSNAVFQPLMSIRLTKTQAVIVRPVVTMVNSVPHFDQHGHSDRTAGFGDTVLAFATPHAFLGGRLTLGAGPTFIFPTASEGLLGQDNWQIGPDAGGALLGKHFIAYAFVQQWFKAGGDGRNTNQMNGVFSFTYLFDNGWTIGTQPTLSVDWKAPAGQRGTFPVGPQIGKLCKCGGTPTLVQLQVQYYPIRPDVGGPKWNVQLQVTPTIPALLKKPLL